jgi:hypothetical protein
MDFTSEKYPATIDCPLRPGDPFFEPAEEWRVRPVMDDVVPGWLVSCGRGKTFFKGIGEVRWQRVPLPLPRETVLQVEIVFNGSRFRTIYVSDAICVSGIRVAAESFDDRRRAILKFIAANDRFDAPAMIQLPSELVLGADWLQDRNLVLDPAKHAEVFRLVDGVTREPLETKSVEGLILFKTAGGYGSAVPFAETLKSLRFMRLQNKRGR